MADEAPTATSGSPTAAASGAAAVWTPREIRRHLGAAALLLTCAVLLSRIIGYLREALVAAWFGANPGTDAFYAAFTIPDFLLYLVAGGTLSVTFIPIYTRCLQSEDPTEGDRTFSVIATTMTLVLLALVAGGYFLAPAAVRWYLSDLPPKVHPLAVRLVRILLLPVPMFYLGSVAAATLFARKRFLAAASAPLLYNLGIIAGGGLLGRLSGFGVEGLVWGAVAGAFVGPLLLQAVAAWRAGLRYRPSLDVRNPGFLEWIRLSLPLMIGVSVVMADEWIYRHFAAGVPGAVSCLSYARKLVSVPIAVAGQAVAQASMPFFAQLYIEQRTQELADTLARTVRAVAVVCLLGGAFLVALAEPLIDLLFRHGHFPAGDVGRTASYLALFAAALPLWGVVGLYARAFYAAHDTLRPMVAGTLVTAVSIPMYALLFRWLGVPGLCIASGLAILMHTAALFVLLPRVLPAARTAPRIRGPLARALLLAGIAGAAARAGGRLAGMSGLRGHPLDLLAILAGGALFVLVALAGARRLGIEEVDAIVRRFKGRLARRRAATAGTT